MPAGAVERVVRYDGRIMRWSAGSTALFGVSGVCLLTLGLMLERTVQAQESRVLPSPAQLSGYRLARISPGPAAPLYVDWKSGCPQLSDTCIQQGLTLQPGTLVVARSHQNGLTQVEAAEVSGRYVATDRVANLPTPAAPPVAAWEGTWKSSADRLILRRSANGTLTTHGNAFWYGAQGVVHFGEADGRAKPHGRTMQVLSPSGETGCGLDLVLLGDLLYVQDNGNCGGMNVHFDGFYRRQGTHTTASRKVRMER